jgi:NH3-dependent NAD+ synthetase
MTSIANRWLRDYARRCGFHAAIGCSEVLIARLTLALVEALRTQTTAITMPSLLSESSISDSEVLCRNLGIELLTHPIQDISFGL